MRDLRAADGFYRGVLGMQRVGERPGMWFTPQAGIITTWHCNNTDIWGGKHMQEIVINAPVRQEYYKVRAAALPRLADTEVLIRVHAAGVYRPI